jgi:anti-anti-sigma factor
MTTTPEDAAREGRGAADRVDAVLYLDRHLRVTYSPTPPSALIRLIGELDTTNTLAVAETLTQVRAREDILIIDTGQLDFIDLASLRMLNGLCHDGLARLTNMPPHMLRLVHLLDCTDTRGYCA